jgi:uncharacterized membrane protein YeaQ/YmgE (transglycosylase-associated protein family)
MHFLWIILIGFIAGIIAKLIHPGPNNEPSGFILTTLLGIAGALRRRGISRTTFIGNLPLRCQSCGNTAPISSA